MLQIIIHIVEVLCSKTRFSVADHLYCNNVKQIPTFFSPYISQVVQLNILIFYMVRFFTETKSAKQESDSGSDDDAPLSSYHHPGSNNRAPQPPGPTETKYLACYLSHRNKQLKVDKNTDSTEQQ